MNETLSSAHTLSPDPHQEMFSKNVLGFWIYLMTDCLLFGTLFSAYAILHRETFGGVGPADIFHLPTVIAETSALLISSVTCGLGVLASLRKDRKWVIIWLVIALAMGLSFVGMEINEFAGLIREGHGPDKSAFLSSFFSLVGTHGLHVSIGSFWLIILLCQLFYYGITTHTFRRLVIFSLFWHFLDLVWIFIFTFVYLMGVAT